MNLFWVKLSLSYLTPPTTRDHFSPSNQFLMDNNLLRNIGVSGKFIFTCWEVVITTSVAFKSLWLEQFDLTNLIQYRSCIHCNRHVFPLKHLKISGLKEFLRIPKIFLLIITTGVRLVNLIFLTWLECSISHIKYNVNMIDFYDRTQFPVQFTLYRTYPTFTVYGSVSTPK